MKQLILFGSILLYSLSGNAQSGKPDPTVKKSFAELGLGVNDFKRIINEQWSTLITGSGSAAPGNYISANIKDADASAAVTNVFKNGTILNLKVSGGTTDGLLSVFSNSTLNSKVSAELKYHVLFYQKQKLAVYNEDLFEFNNKKAQLEYDYKIKSLAILGNKELNGLKKEKEELEKKMPKLDSVYKRLEGLLKVEKDTRKSDSLSVLKELAELELSTASERVKFIDNSILKYPSFAIQQFNLDNWRAKEYKKIKTSLPVVGFRFGWFSFAYKVSKNGFKLFDPSASFASQIKDTNNVSHEFTAQYSYYDFSSLPNRSLFMDAGVVLALSDNFTDLKKKEMQETSNYGPAPGDRESTKKYNAYTGAYKKKLSSARLFFDAYKFLFKENAVALHIFPEYLVKEDAKPTANLGIGAVLSLKDGSNGTSIVNTEIYYNFLDLFDTKNSDKGFWERNDIGLRFTFPIKFKTK